MDWHELSVGAISVVLIMGGWVWVRAIQQLDRIEKRQDAHIEADRVEFGHVYERINATSNLVAALDARVDERFIARDHR